MANSAFDVVFFLGVVSCVVPNAVFVFGVASLGNGVVFCVIFNVVLNFVDDDFRACFFETTGTNSTPRRANLPTAKL